MNVLSDEQRKKLAHFMGWTTLESIVSLDVPALDWDAWFRDDEFIILDEDWLQPVNWWHMGTLLNRLREKGLYWQLVTISEKSYVCDVYRSLDDMYDGVEIELPEHEAPDAPMAVARVVLAMMEDTDDNV